MKKAIHIFMAVVTLLLSLSPNLLFAQGKVEGISKSEDCLRGMGKDCFTYEKVIGIDKYKKGDNTAKSLAQDIVFAATYMVGTVLTLVVIYCGLMYIFAAKDGKDPKTYKDGLVKAAIGALLVRGAYAIVRLIQYIAKG